MMEELGYDDIVGVFPWCKSSRDLTVFVKRLHKECARKTLESERGVTMKQKPLTPEECFKTPEITVRKTRRIIPKPKVLELTGNFPTFAPAIRKKLKF